MVRPHMLDTYTPALLGPLNSGADSLRPRPGRAVAVAMALCSYEGRGPEGSGRDGARSSERAQYSERTQFGERAQYSERSGRDGRGGRDDSDDEGSSVAGGGERSRRGGGVGTGGPLAHCSALLTAFRDGRVYAHALDDGAIRGAWVEGTPQCRYDHRGDIYAVRTECHTLPLENVQGGWLCVAP